jgi:hypothetical protein
MSFNQVIKNKRDCKDKPPDNNQRGSISQTLYSIRAMNNFLRRSQKTLYSTLPFNQEVPPLLRLAFLQMHAEKPDADFNI